MITTTVFYANGSTSYHHHQSMGDAYKHARYGISYSGNRVARVELLDRHSSSPRAVYDHTWTLESMKAGLGITGTIP